MSADYWGDPYDGARHPDQPEPADKAHAPEPGEAEADERDLLDLADESDYAAHPLGRRLGKGHWR